MVDATPVVDVAGPSVDDVAGPSVDECGATVLSGTVVVSAAVVLSGAAVESANVVLRNSVAAGEGVVGITKHSGQPGQPFSSSVALSIPDSHDSTGQSLGAGHSVHGEHNMVVGLKRRNNNKKKKKKEQTNRDTRQTPRNSNGRRDSMPPRRIDGPGTRSSHSWRILERTIDIVIM